MVQHQVILAMITDSEKWDYFPVKNISRLALGIASNHNTDSCCVNCLHSFRTENELNPFQHGLFMYVESMRAWAILGMGGGG